MDIEKILQYQACDQVLARADSEFQASEENRRYQDLRSKVTGTSAQLINRDREAGELYKEVERLEGLLTEYIEKAKATPLNGAKTLEQVAKLEENEKKLEDELAGIERELNKALKRLADISKEAQQLHKQYVRFFNEAKAANTARMEKRAQIIKGVSKEGNLLNELKKSIPDADMELYQQLRAAKVRLPIVVECRGGNCCGCGMDISAELGTNKLQNSGDIAECPHCRRILYVK